MDYEDTNSCLTDVDTGDLDNSSLHANGGQPVKSYIRTIREKTELAPELRAWVENEITNISRRIHKVGINDITAYFIQGNARLELGYTPDYICDVMGIDCNSQRKKVLGLAQGHSRGKSAISYSSIVVPMIVTHPKEFIPEITEAFAKRKGLDPEDDVRSQVLRVRVRLLLHYVRLWKEWEATGGHN